MMTQKMLALSPVSVDRYAKASREILNKLPRNAARACTPSHRPFDRLSTKIVCIDFKAVLVGIALDHLDVVGLVAVMETQPQAEPIR